MLLYIGLLLSLSATTLAERDIKLYNILKPSDTQRFFDTLRHSVEEQYSNQHIYFDISTIQSQAEKTISIERLNRKYNDVLYEGDMAIGYEQLEALVNSAVGNRAARNKFLREKVRAKRLHKRQAYVDSNYPATIWKSVVPFAFDNSLSAIAKSSILKAIHFWYRETCISFTPRKHQKEYIQFIGNEEGCWSTVGRDPSKGRQVVSIGEGCEHFGITTHEIAHALGMFHEQSRYDRDEHIMFNAKVVEPDMIYNFAKISPHQLSTYGLPYDVGSVMHYTPTEFSTSDSIPTLVATDINLQQTMGQMGAPSFIDVFLVNKHYNCQAKCKRQLPCQNGGYTNSRNCKICKCPSGFAGRLCAGIPPSFSKRCGGELMATETTRRFDINIRQNGRIRDKMCIYHIKAPANKRIIVEIINIKSRCVEGCWEDGMELKMRKDFRPVGYRFCCSQTSRRKVVSDTNLVPLMIYSKKDTVSVTLEYSYVDVNAKYDSTIINNEIIRRSLDG